jgi:hypothetical protein
VCSLDEAQLHDKYILYVARSAPLHLQTIDILHGFPTASTKHKVVSEIDSYKFDIAATYIPQCKF